MMRNSWKILAICSLVFAFGLMGCSGDEGGLECGANSCTPNGTCVMVDGNAACDCADGYVQNDPNVLTCEVDSTKLLGQSCTADDECISGRCLKYTGDATGYCTTTNCVTDSQCTNHEPGETAEMCCVEVDAAYFICLKIAEGYACGDGTGTCGASCTGTADSACDIEHPCLRSSDTDPKAICSATCATDSDCSACSWSVNPDAAIGCVTISGGDKYCLVTEIDGCDRTLDCPEGDTCSIGVNAELTELFGECMNVGGLPPGSECNDADDPNLLTYEQRCSGFYCLGGMCSEVCVVDNDCPEGMICEVLQFSNVDDTITVCMGDATCGGPADCAEGEACFPTLSGNDLTGWCREVEPGTDPAGTACDPDNDTCEVWCMDTMCTEWCTVNEDCPNAMVCEVINFCIDEPCTDPSNLAPGSVCIEDLGCEGPDGCEAGMACFPTLTYENDLQGWCRGVEPDTDPVGTVCDEENDTCEVWCMDTLCTEWCTVDENCPNGMVCETINFCIADPCTDPNNLAPGSVCIEDLSCANGTECEAGFSCWPTLTYENDLQGWCREDEGVDPVGTACDEENDTCEVMCMDALCTEWCTLDADCPNEMICETIGFCIADPCTDPANIAGGSVCIADNSCGTPADCEAGFGCWPTLNYDNSLSGWCREDAGADALGTACDQDNDTCEVLCIGDGTTDMCSEVCTVAGDCAAGQDCQNVGICIADPCTDPNNIADVMMCVPAE